MKGSQAIEGMPTKGMLGLRPLLSLLLPGGHVGSFPGHVFPP